LIFERNSAVLSGMRGPMWVDSNCLKQNASSPRRRALETLMKWRELARKGPMNAKLLILRAAANVSPTNGVNLRESSFVHYGVLKYRLEQSRPLARAMLQGHAPMGGDDEGGGGCGDRERMRNTGTPYTVSCDLLFLCGIPS
jgi:hypothetical protein